MRFRTSSIGQLLVTIGICAIGCAAVANPTRPWMLCLLALTTCVMGSFGLGAACSRGERRGGHVGAALLGLAYITLVFGPSGFKICPYLPTTWIIEHLPQGNSAAGILECPDDNTPDPPAVEISYSIGEFRRWYYPTPSANLVPVLGLRQQIGHLIAALFAAWIGWIGGRCFVAKIYEQSPPG